MGKNKEVIILSKSRKHGGYCVAAIDCSDQGLVRLISSNPTYNYAVFDEDIKNESGKVAEVLDKLVIVVSNENNINLPFQPENILLDTEYYFYNKGFCNKSTIRKDIEFLCNKHDYILFNTKRYLSSIELSKINNRDIHSLELVNADRLTIRVKDSIKRRLKGSILYKNNWYNDFTVTDMEFEKKMYDEVANAQRGYKTICNPYLLISLGEEFNGKHYKLIASVLDI